MKKIKHAVVIVNYNGSSDTIACLESVRATKDAPHPIVIDNGSSDNSVKALREHDPSLDLIVSPVNLGFSGGHNLGIKRALRLGAKVVHLLNNDTYVDKDLFFRAYRHVVGQNRLATGKIYYAPGYEYHVSQHKHGKVLWYAGGEIDWSNCLGLHRGVDQVDLGQFDTLEPTNFATGCYLAIPRAIFKKIGFLDESYFLYLEDLDYSIRAHHAGIEIVYNPKLIVYHKNSQSSGGAGNSLVDYYMTRNRLLLAKKYGKLRLRFALYREALTRNWTNPTRRQAFLDFFFNRLGKKR